MITDPDSYKSYDFFDLRQTKLTDIMKKYNNLNEIDRRMLFMDLVSNPNIDKYL